MVHGVRDMRRIEREYEPADQPARGAVHEMAHQIERARPGQRKGGEDRQVLKRRKCLKIGAEDPAQEENGEQLRPGEGVVDE